jgi:hypothetical protein
MHRQRDDYCMGAVCSEKDKIRTKTCLLVGCIWPCHECLVARAYFAGRSVLTSNQTADGPNLVWTLVDGGRILYSSCMQQGIICSGDFARKAQTGVVDGERWTFHGNGDRSLTASDWLFLLIKIVWCCVVSYCTSYNSLCL